MELLPFEKAYEKIREDIFGGVSELRIGKYTYIYEKEQLKDAFDGVKPCLVMPSCNDTGTIVYADEDDLWTTERLRKF